MLSAGCLQHVQYSTLFVQVIEEPYLKIIYTADERYAVKKSVYSNNVSTSNSMLRAPRFLTIAVDADERRQLEQQIRVCVLHLKTLLEQEKRDVFCPYHSITKNTFLNKIQFLVNLFFYHDLSYRCSCQMVIVFKHVFKLTNIEICFLSNFAVI